MGSCKSNCDPHACGIQSDTARCVAVEYANKMTVAPVTSELAMAVLAVPYINIVLYLQRIVKRGIEQKLVHFVRLGVD